MTILLCAAGLVSAQIFGSTNTQGYQSPSSASTAPSGTTLGSSLSSALPNISANAVLAMASPDYPVSPGDIYSLSFTRASQKETISLLVEGDGTINAGFLGRIQTAGMKFVELRDMLQKKIEASYPNSNPSLIIVSTGSFPVTIRGEVTTLGMEQAWGLSRLTYVLKPYLTPYSSRRNVKIISKDGSARTYDLFKAERYGDMSQNPLLRPGDIIEVKKAARIIILSGSVRKPGSYELLEMEGLKDLVQVYGEGFLGTARTNSLILTRRARADLPLSESQFCDFASGLLPQLFDGDMVHVPSQEELLPVIYVEGAIQSGTVQLTESSGAPKISEQQVSSAPQSSAETKFTPSGVRGDQYGIVRAVYRQGQRLFQVMAPLKASIAEKADLRNAYLVRGTERISVDLEKLLYQSDTTQDLVLQPGDRIVIPFGYASVFITGEVLKASVQEVTPGLRLSMVLKDNLAPYASIRDVVVTGLDGKRAVYDLFKAERYGDMSQNPLLRPGDVVEVQKAGRIVQLEGEVRRPGTYQLLSNEGVAELVEIYGEGALSSAKSEFAVLTRKASIERPEGEVIVFDVHGQSLPKLADGDRVRLPGREEYLPVVYVEGALLSDQNPNAYNVQRIMIRQGQTLYQAVKPLESKFSPRADLQNAYIVRGTERIPADLERLLHFYAAQDDIVLQVDDRVVIPFGFATALIKGEVKQAGKIEIKPDLRLSDALKDNLLPRSSKRDILVVSADGKVAVYDLFKAERFGDMSQNPLLRPGDSIEVRSAERLVSVEGEVARPGTYQLLSQEGVDDLIGRMAGGLLKGARTDRMVLKRKADISRPEGESLIFNFSDRDLPELTDGDRVVVASSEEFLPIVYVEGAIVQEQGTGTQSSTQGTDPYTVVRSAFRKGLLASQAVKPIASRISPKADMRKSYIARGTERIPLDLEKLLYFYAPQDDVELQAEDHIVIPFGFNFAYVKGEVQRSSAVEVTAQSRLSDVLKGLVTAYSSTRDVRITGLDGLVKEYDLFKAERAGDTGQNPYVRPGDLIEVKRASRIVRIDGEVRRPGTYQLLEGEGVGNLVSDYADGLLSSAKSDFLVLTRRTSEEKPASESVVFDLKRGDLPQLNDGDVVRVPSREEYLPVVYVEGAVQSAQLAIPDTLNAQSAGAGASPASSAGSAPAGGQKEAYGVARVVFRSGQMVSQVLRRIQTQLSAKADLQNAYIIRGSERIAVDGEALLFRYRAEDDRALAEGDRIVIPFGYVSVTVKGEVQKAAVIEMYGGMRLSDALQGNLTAYSSQRDIEITGSDGKKNVYDLFKAGRYGDLSQNPLLRPGDVIEVKKAARTVKIEGEVRRPGLYQLAEGEGVTELVMVYGDGMLSTAKADAVMLVRKATQNKPQSESLVFCLADANAPVLLDGDTVRIPGTEEYLPVVYLEGAVSGDALAVASPAASGQLSPVEGGQSQLVASGQKVAPTNYSMLRVPYRQGMTVATMLRPIRDRILSSADMAHAFVLRKGSPDPVVINLEKLLYGNELSLDYTLQPEDRLVIPYGSMYVFVTGEVTKSSWIGITGLTRLREVVAPLLTRYSSVRDVVVRTAEGFEKTYDLFKADRYGDLSQDPFLRPGDVIRVASLKNLVTIQGEVKRPGTYQLLPGEGLKQLVEVYADGFTEKANTSKLTLLHYLSESSPVGEKLQLDYMKNSDVQLKLYDVVNVPSIQELLPVVWFEGAVGVGSTGASPETSQRVAYTYFPGETAAQAAQANRKLFSAVSDLANAYILHEDGTKTPVDLAKFIYKYDASGDVALQPNDTFIVPFRQFFVSVSGAVRFPGRYPYIPNRTWEYYIGLAGGFDTDRNSGQKITIYDVKSNKVSQIDRMIQPEDNIVAESNSFTYNLFKVSSIISTILSLAALIVNLLKL